MKPVQRVRKGLPCLEAGFTLIELLIFVTIIVTVLTATIGTVAFSLTSINDSRNRTLASHHSTELAEWMRFKRDICGIDHLNDRDINEVEGGGTAYCFSDPDLPISDIDFCPINDSDVWSRVSSCDQCPYTLEGALQRCATMYQNVDNNWVEISIRTAWYTNEAQQSSTTLLYLTTR